MFFTVFLAFLLRVSLITTTSSADAALVRDEKLKLASSILVEPEAWQHLFEEDPAHHLHAPAEPSGVLRSAPPAAENKRIMKREAPADGNSFIAEVPASGTPAIIPGAPPAATPAAAPVVATVTPPVEDLRPQAVRDLDLLACEEETDKSSHHHNYVDYYGRTFADFRNKPVHLLEVGLGTLGDPKAHASSMKELKDGYKDMGKYFPGASLRMWGNFFTHPNAVIDGADVAEDTMVAMWPSFLTEKQYGGFPLKNRVSTVLGDSQTPDLAGKVKTLKHVPYDFIVDDGLHNPDANVKTLAHLWETLQTAPGADKPGGKYMIEDTVTYVSKLLLGIEALSKHGDLSGLRSVRVETMPASEYSSILVVLEKGAANEKSVWSTHWLEKWREHR